MILSTSHDRNGGLRSVRIELDGISVTLENNAFNSHFRIESAKGAYVLTPEQLIKAVGGTK